MAYPYVATGDPFTPKADFHNALVDIVNGNNNVRIPERRTSVGGAVYIKVYNQSTVKILSGTAVTFTTNPLVDNAVPVDRFTIEFQPWGVLVGDLEVSGFGLCAVSGQAWVRLQSTGDLGSYFDFIRLVPEEWSGLFKVSQIVHGGSEILWWDPVNKPQKALVDLKSVKNNEYCGYFTIIPLEYNKAVVVDGATWDGTTSGKSICKVNNREFEIDPAEITLNEAGEHRIYINFTASRDSDGNATIDGSTCNISTEQEGDAWYQIGRLISDNMTFRVIQEHKTGIPQILWYDSYCGL